MNPAKKAKDYAMVSYETLKGIVDRPDYAIKMCLASAQYAKINPDRTPLVSYSMLAPLTQPSSRNLDLAKTVGFDRQICLPDGSKVPSVASADYARETIKLKTSLVDQFDGYVVAGGAIIASVLDQDVNDIDCFIHSKNNNHKTILREMLIHIQERGIEYETDFTSAFRNLYRTEIGILDECPIQIIHRAYTTAPSVIAGFDQLCCQAFYDGEEIYFSLAAAICLIFNINVVDDLRESRNMNARIHKYADKYFYRTVLVNLPAIILSMDAYKHNAILLDRIINVRPYGYRQFKKIEKSNAGKDSGCDFSDYGRTIDPEILEQNVDLDDEEKMIYWTAMLSVLSGDNYESANFSYSWNRIDEAKFNLVGILDHPTPPPIDDWLKECRFGHLKGPFRNLVSLKFQLNNLMKESRLDGIKGRMDSSKLDKLSVAIDAYNQRLNEFKNTVRANINKLKSKLIEIPFLTVDPGRQYTSSFHPVVGRSPLEFWGPAYIPFDRSIGGESMLQLMLIKKFRPNEAGALYWLDVNIMKMIHRHLLTAIIFA